jgi:hypothetical protein
MDALPAPLSVLFLLACGSAFLWAALRARTTGEIRAGVAGLRPFRPRRDDNPGAFYLFQALYVVFGAWLVLYAIRIATGDAPPLPLR